MRESKYQLIGSCEDVVPSTETLERSDMRCCSFLDENSRRAAFQTMRECRPPRVKRRYSFLRTLKRQQTIPHVQPPPRSRWSACARCAMRRKSVFGPSEKDEVQFF